ncbi:MAG: PIN domain-containing protein [Gammaproteobacteria bacterium]|nr:PIN domain-containing protein [Gammaproteobacteria bacterium]
MPVFDATTLLYFLEKDAKPPLDPATGTVVTDPKARIDFLISNLESRRETIVIPTPALSEVLVHAGKAGPEYLKILSSTRCFRVEAFDQRAAVELATMTYDAISVGDLRAGTNATRAKLKFDRQIIAIARIQGQTAIYSDDGDVAKLAKPLDIKVIPVHDLPLPPTDPQAEFAFPPNGAYQRSE